MATLNNELPKTDRGWQAYLSNLAPPKERRAVSMGGSLVVWLEKSGAKRFEARVRRRGDANPRRIPVGNFPASSVADARKKVLEIKSIAAEGRDPALEARRARAGVQHLRTLDDLIRAYLERRATLVASKTVKIDRDLLQGVLSPALGDRLLADLEPVDFGRAVAAYAARLRLEGRSAGSNANALLKVARHMFKATGGWGLYSGDDPTRGLTKPVKDHPRDRILFDGTVLAGPSGAKNEIGILVRALTSEPSTIPVSLPTRIALLLTISMGFRALEVSSLEWSAIDLEATTPTVTVTNSKTKAGRRTLPLTAHGVELLLSLRASRKANAQFVFPAEEGATRAEHIHPESLSRAFARTIHRLGIHGATLHDLRRTCLSGIIELGHEGVAEKIAGHVPKHVLGRHYDQSRRREPMRRALEDWANSIANAADRAQPPGGEAGGG